MDIPHTTPVNKLYSIMSIFFYILLITGVFSIAIYKQIDTIFYIGVTLSSVILIFNLLPIYTYYSIKNEKKKMITEYIEKYNSNIPKNSIANCTICYDDITDDLFSYKDCGHQYHLKCIKKWIEINKSCPICRAVYP